MWVLFNVDGIRLSASPNQEDLACKQMENKGSKIQWMDENLEADMTGFCKPKSLDIFSEDFSDFEWPEEL